MTCQCVFLSVFVRFAHKSLLPCCSSLRTFQCFLSLSVINIKFENSNGLLWHFVEMSLKWMHARKCAFLACTEDLMRGTAPEDRTAAVISPLKIVRLKTFNRRKLPSGQASVWPCTALIAPVISTWGSQAGQSSKQCHLSLKNKTINLSLYLSCTEWQSCNKRNTSATCYTAYLTASNVVIWPVLHLRV